MLTALLLVGLLVHRILDDWYRTTVHRDSLPERKMRQYDLLQGELDTLIFGDSHALSGVEPDLLGAAFDLALPGQYPASVYALLAAKLAESDSRVERVVLQADLHTFWPHPQKFALLRYYAPVTDFLVLGWQRGEPLRYGVRGWLGRFAPYVGERTMMLGYLADGRPPELAWLRDRPLTRGGFLTDMRWLDLPTDERARMASERVEIHYQYGDAVDEVAESYFRRSLELARSLGIGVLVVQYPVSPAYMAAAVPWIDVSALDRRLGALLAAHPEGHRLDARDLFFGRTEFFADPDHINRGGARELTRRIRVELGALEAAGA